MDDEAYEDDENTAASNHKSNNDKDDSNDSIDDEQHQQMMLLKDGGDTTTMALAMDGHWQHSFNNYNLDASLTGMSTTTACRGEDDYPPWLSFHGGGAMSSLKPPLTPTSLMAMMSQMDLLFIPIVIRINVITQHGSDDDEQCKSGGVART